MISAALQTALYQKLNGTAALTNLVTGIYDLVPQELSEDNPPEDVFPYVVIGDDRISAWDTDTELGFEANITIHVWTRAGGREKNQLILKQIYLALHRQVLTVTGYNTVSGTFTESDLFIDADGLSQHGVISFRFLADTI